jgi:hypothetical protein
MRVSPPKALLGYHSKYQPLIVSIKNIRSVGSMVHMVDTCLVSMKPSAQTPVPQNK